MRIAFISDIHGHLVAFDVVLADIQQRRVDALYCLGDVATIGPHPREVLALLQRLACPCVLGNHDAVLLWPHKAKELSIAETLLPSLEWCRDRMGNTEIGFLRSFRPTIKVTLVNDYSLLCFHGSPTSTTDVITPFTSDTDLVSLFSGTDACILAGGHTHLQMRREFGGRLLINPGSVGSVFRQLPTITSEASYQPWSEYAILDTHDLTPDVEMYRVDLDVKLVHRSVEGIAMPMRDWWLKQYQ